MENRRKTMEEILSDLNVETCTGLYSPAELIRDLPLTPNAFSSVIKGRKEIENILDKKDKRKIIITGPCSIHDYDSAIEYAHRLKKLSEEVSDQVLIIMRTYLEKPRSCLGWKGYIYSPELDERGNIPKGLRESRKILRAISELGLPCANEFVNSIFPQYLSDLLSWVAIGARTTESQSHRELASGLSMPVGFKNNTAGEISSAIDAAKSANSPHTFLGVTQEGKTCIVETKGNPYCHVVLRGGNGVPNCTPEMVAQTLSLEEKTVIPKNIIIDCSHGNSEKKYEKQEEVSYKVLDQITSGTQDIVGIMLESHLFEGKQSFPKNPEEAEKLKYGISITDGCIDWQTTERIIKQYAEELRRQNEFTRTK
jgi:3-deoxy-7-phosphoheptulonate synthase